MTSIPGGAFRRPVVVRRPKDRPADSQYTIQQLVLGKEELNVSETQARSRFKTKDARQSNAGNPRRVGSSSPRPIAAPRQQIPGRAVARPARAEGSPAWTPISKRSSQPARPTSSNWTRSPDRSLTPEMDWGRCSTPRVAAPATPNPPSAAPVLRAILKSEPPPIRARRTRFPTSSPLRAR